MFHFFVESKINEKIVDSFINCFLDNCQSEMNKDSAEVFIDICESTDNKTYLYATRGLLSVFHRENELKHVQVAIIATLPEYVDKSIVEKTYALERPCIVLLVSKNKTNYQGIVEFVCFCIFKFFLIDSLLEPISFKEVDNLYDSRKVIEKNFNVITDQNGNKSYTKNKDSALVDSHTIERSLGSDMFHVRRRFTDYGSEKLATRDLQRAVTECNKYTGYHVYNDEGKAIYESVKNKTVVNNNRSVVLPTEKAIIRTGNGIRLKSQSGEFISIDDGEVVQISKRIGNETEILVSRNGKQYKTFVNSDVLANF